MQRRCLGRILAIQPEFLFQGPGIRSTAWPLNHHQNRDHCRGLPIVPPSNISLRTFATARPEGDSGHGSHKIAQAAERDLSDLEQKINKILQKPALPSEESVWSSLQSCEAYAELITKTQKPSSPPLQGDMSPASTLLSLEERRPGTPPIPPIDADLGPPTRKKNASRISKMAYSILTNRKTFITPEMLASYVHIQSLLGFPKTIPQVFVLYASKPVPHPGSSPPRYSASNPNKASSAIPLVTAQAGLTAAIEARDLPVCFDIINTSVCATAFRRSKFVRRALLPIITGFGLVPVAAYTLASQMSTYQNTMDPEVATNMAFAGIMAYVGFTAIIGVVAITTANDQMDRITWATGTPLRERWLREEERALIDRVAGAWGFKELLKRGEEEGRDWETLREWVGLRGMMLDRVELMEGME